MHKKLIFIVILFIIATVALFYFLQIQKKSQKDKLPTQTLQYVKYGTWSIPEAYLLNLITWVAKDKDFFKKNGLDVELVPAAEPITAFNAKTVDVTNAGLPIPTQETVDGTNNIKWIATVQKNNQYFLLSTKDPAQIKSVATVKQSPVNKIITLMFLNKFNIKQEDINFVEFEDGKNQLMAILEEKVDAAAISPGLYTNLSRLFADQIKDKNVRVLYELSQEEESILPIGVFSNTDYIEKNQKTLEKLLQALREANKFIMENPQETAQIYAKRTQQNPKDAQSFVDTYIKGIKSTTISKPNPKAIQNVLDILAKTDPKAKDFKAESLIDYSVINQIFP